MKGVVVEVLVDDGGQVDREHVLTIIPFKEGREDFETARARLRACKRPAELFLHTAMSLARSRVAQ